MQTPSPSRHSGSSRGETETAPGRRREAPSLGHWAYPWQTQADSPGLGGSMHGWSCLEGACCGDAPCSQAPATPLPLGTGSHRSHLHKGTKQSWNPTKGEAGDSQQAVDAGGRAVQSNPCSRRRGGHTPGPTGRTLGHPEGPLSRQAYGRRQGPEHGGWGRGWDHAVGGQGAGPWGSWPRPPLLRARTGPRPALEFVT